MTYEKLVNSKLLKQPVYQTGKPIELVAQEQGIDVADIIKLASNESLLGPSPLALEAVQRALPNVHRYGDGTCLELKEKLGRILGLSNSQLIFGNGSNEIMVLIGQALLNANDEVVMGNYAFIVGKIVALMFGAKLVEVPMPNLKHDLNALKRAITERTKLLYLPHPNNPTGDSQDLCELDNFIDQLPDHVVLLVDEAYVDYLEPEKQPNFKAYQKKGKKIICCRTFSKVYGLAGLRIGYAYGHEEFIDLLKRIRQPFNVNVLARIAAAAALNDTDFVQKNIKASKSGQKQLSNLLKNLGLQYFSSPTNFGLLKISNGKKIYQQLQKLGIIVRPLDPYGLPNYLRLTVGNEAENECLVDCLNGLLE